MENKDENNKKGKRIVDKILMGAVIGGAIGSVLGATIAPKKGKETRKDLVETAKSATKTSKALFLKIKGFLKKDKDGEEEPKRIPQEK